jgi:hypothetical protein
MRSTKPRDATAKVSARTADAPRPHPRDAFVEVLLSFPGGVAFERDPTPPRETKL